MIVDYVYIYSFTKFSRLYIYTINKRHELDMTCMMKTFPLWLVFLHIQLGAPENILDRLGAGVRKFHRHHLAV